MIYPRFVARFFAWLLGYFWLPCPICGENFAGFEWPMGASTIVEEGGEVREMGVCAKPNCMAEGERRRMAYMQARWEAISSQRPDKQSSTG